MRNSLSSIFLFNHCDNFIRIGVPSVFLIFSKLKNGRHKRNRLNIRFKLSQERGHQTDGSGCILSNGAIDNFDFHLDE